MKLVFELKFYRDIHIKSTYRLDEAMYLTDGKTEEKEVFSISDISVMGTSSA